MKKQAIILWIISALLVSCLSLMGAGRVEAQASQEPIWSYTTGGANDSVWSIAISSNGNYIVAGSRNGKVYLFGRSSNTPLWTYQTGEGVSSVAISRDGYFLVAGSDKVYLFNRSGTIEWIYNSGSVESVAISGDGNYIAVKARPKIYLFSTWDGTPIWESDVVTGQTNYLPHTIAITYDGSYIVAGSGSKVYLYRKSDNIPVWSYQAGGDIKSLSISSDGNYLVAGTNYGIYLFSTSSSTPLWTYPTTDLVWSVAISPNGNYIVAGERGGNVDMFSLGSNNPLWRYQTGDGVVSVAISRDGEYIVAGGWARKVYLFGRSNETPLWSYQTDGYSERVSISLEGDYVAAGTSGWASNKVYLFSREFPNTPPTLTSGSVSPTSGTTDTTFTYEVTYTDADGDAPLNMFVFIDDVGHSMSKVSGTYTGGATYRCTKSGLGLGAYTYYFWANDMYATTRLPASGSYSGPTVAEQRSTSLTVSPSSFTVGIGGSQDLSALLKEEVTYIIGGGVYYTTWEPLAGKNITWDATSGSFSSSSTTTDSSGQASVIYYAPSYETTATITASFAGDSQYEASSDEASATVQFEVTLTFYKPDGSALAYTEIYYGTLEGQETSYLGVTDSQGKITSTNSALAGDTIYFKSPDGTYSGSTYVESSGGSSNIWLTETSGAPGAGSPWAIVAVILIVIVGGVAGMLVLKKVFFKPKSVKRIMKVKPPEPIPIKLAKTAKRALKVKSSKPAPTKPAGPFCSHCKLKLPADAAFCPECGRKVKR